MTAGTAVNEVSTGAASASPPHLSSMRIVERAATIGIESAFEVLARAQQLEREGRDVVHLEAGEPDWPTPPHVVEAGVKALRDGFTKYSGSPGIPELRDAIAESVAARGIHATRDQVCITPGSKLTIFHALMALLEPGDEALVPDPGYPTYGSVTTFIGARAVPYLVSAESEDGLDVAELAEKITPRTRVLVINSPHNPTGRAIRAQTLEAIAELAQRHHLTVISDEIYGRLTFGKAGEISPSIAALPGMAERTVVVDGFSKTYAMTGWRLGYGVMPVALAQVIARLNNNTIAHTPVFVQKAGIAALTGPQDSVAEMVDELRARRDLITRGLNAISGITCAVPDGAFYVLPDVSAILSRSGETSKQLATRLLDDQGVACLPGTAFGANAAGRLRFAYTTNRSAIASALVRVEKAVAN